MNFTFPLVLAVFSAIFLFWFLIRVLLLRNGWIFAAIKWRRRLEDCFHVYLSFKVPEFNHRSERNPLYRKVHAYLSSIPALEDSDFTNLIAGKNPKDVVLRLDPNQTVEDVFLGAKVLWINEEETLTRSCRNFVLKIRNINTVTADATDRKRGDDLKLYINLKPDNHFQRWKSVSFTHPSTFDAIIMESDLKEKVKSDLDSFLKAKQYYHRVGRVWKRSYLLYGPSGTGKSNFVAAMANFLCYDVYYIDLAKINNESDLKLLLVQTTCKSIIVVEDLDRHLTEKSPAISSSELLNFMDGILTSCCAEERVIVYTMSSKDRVDPDIMRPGRIDVHMHFPLCDFSAFKNVASSYLGLKDHKLFPQVEEIFPGGASLSTAEITELIIPNRNSPSRAIKSVISALQKDGEGRGLGKSGRRQSRNSLKKSAAEDTAEDGGANENWKGGKETKKWFGLVRMKSNKVSQSVDEE